MIETSEKDFKRDIIDSKELVLVYFGASWCGPCKVLHKVLEDISNNIKIFKVDVDENPELSNTYNITGVPTVILFKDGEIKGISVGLNAKKFYLDQIEGLK